MPNIKKTIFAVFGIAALLTLFISEALKEIIKPVTQKLAVIFWQNYLLILAFCIIIVAFYLIYARFFKKSVMNEGIIIKSYHLSLKKTNPVYYEFKSILELELPKGGILNFREKAHVTSGQFAEVYVLYKNKKIEGHRQAASGSNTDIITYSFPEKFPKNSFVEFEIIKTAEEKDIKMRPYLAKTIHDLYKKLTITVDLPIEENVVFTAIFCPYYDADDKNELNSGVGETTTHRRRIYTYEFTNFGINNYCCITWN